MNRPLFITVDALDGVGKTTLVRNVAQSLGATGMATPGASLRPLCSAVLSGLEREPTACALFFAASVVARGREARAVVDAGVTVVMDRYWLSTLAYGLARGADAALTGVGMLMPRPDLSIVLTLDEGERHRRLVGRGDLTEADLETLEPVFRDEVVAHLSGVHARGFAPLAVVDVTGADEAVAAGRVIAAILAFASLPEGPS